MKRQEEILESPQTLAEKLQLPPEVARIVRRNRQEIKEILDRRDKRLLVIAGPCSIHNVDAALEYAHKLAALAREVSGEIKLVMRCYFEKPRTTLGWKGLIYDPAMDGSNNIALGLQTARQLLLDIAELGLGTATELLDPAVAVYLEDLISWSSIGARTVESPMHRQLASSLDMPVGFKNSTDGNLQIAVDAICAAMAPHSYIGTLHDGKCGIIRSCGNPYCHIVLRGGASGENYYAVCVAAAVKKLQKMHLNTGIVIDCSHGNSRRDPARQHIAFGDAVSQKAAGNSPVVGVMLESNLLPGKQPLTQGAIPDARISVTDGCIGWEETQQLIRDAARMLQKQCAAPKQVQLPQVSYLGPAGTFTHLAAQKVFSGEVDYRPSANIAAVFQEVESGACDFGCVPVENSSEGVINSTLDLLAASPLKIYAESTLAVHQNLLSAVPKEKIGVIYSHIQSLGQCRNYLEKNFPDVETIGVSSNARAAELASHSANAAVIGGIGLADLYHLDILERSIEDDKENRTRFFILSKSENTQLPHAKCCIWFTAKERFGALHDCLTPFKNAGISLSMIESRPVRNDKNQYRFFIDIAAALESPKAAAVLAELKELTQELHVLGSFPVFE